MHYSKIVIAGLIRNRNEVKFGEANLPPLGGSRVKHGMTPQNKVLTTKVAKNACGYSPLLLLFSAKNGKVYVVLGVLFEVNQQGIEAFYRLVEVYV